MIKILSILCVAFMSASLFAADDASDMHKKENPASQPVSTLDCGCTKPADAPAEQPKDEEKKPLVS